MTTANAAPMARLLAAAAIPLTGILFLSNAADPVNVPKLTALALSALLLMGSVAVAAVRARTLRLAWGPAAVAGAALAAALTVSTVVAPERATALVGAYGRNSGLIAYLCALTLFFGILMVFDAAATRILGFAVLLAGLFTAIYGLLQRLGGDPIAWNNPFNPIIATLGNPDFASAYMGITVPVAVWGACWTGWHVALRVASGVLAALCLSVAAISSAVQGPVAAGAGLAVVALALALDLTGHRRRVALGGVGTVIATGALVGAAGPLGIGPARSFFSGIPWDSRTWYWQAAVDMWQRSPITGIGLDAYGMYWYRDRPLASPRKLGGAAYSDSAHSVPLQHLAQGGILLGLAYLFFLAVVAWCLLRGLRRLAGQERLLLAGLGGAWVAYQVQSVVSIDHVALLTLNYILGAGVVVASGAVTTREVRLPGALPPVTAGRGRRPKTPATRKLTAIDAALLAGIGVTFAVGSWLALVPLRASYALYSADVASIQGDSAAATKSFQRAVELAPAVAMYKTRLGDYYQASGRPAEARAVLEAAFDQDPSQINAGRTAAQLAVEAGDLDAADRVLTRVLEVDPSNSATILAWARLQLQRGEPSAARTRLERGVRDLPGEAVLWTALGDTRRTLGDKAGARAAYEQALVVFPGETAARDALQTLDAASG